jgi:hypothetical protein
VRRSFLVILAVVFLAAPAVAQYSFELPRMEATVAVNRDGTCDLYYAITFVNLSWAQPIDIVDIGMPRDTYDLETAAAWITPPVAADSLDYRDPDAVHAYTQSCTTQDTLIPLSGIYTSEYVDPGVEVHLDPYIYEGELATLVFQIKLYHLVYPDSEKEDYASVEFAPTWYGSEYVQGTEDLTLKIVFPPGVTPEETVYHRRKFDFTGALGEGENQQLVFVWHDPAAPTGSQLENVGVSFPRKYLDEDAVYEPSAIEEFFKGVWGFIVGIFNTLGWCLVPIAFFVLSALFSFAGRRRRRLKYLPPTASVEGVGIKRGLTAVEAGIVLELKLDRVLNLIIFGLLKKGRLEVTGRDPLRLKALPAAQSLGADAGPAKLRPYEVEFLAAIDDVGSLKRAEVRKAFINLINAVNKKMKGFSRRETRDYYRSIIAKAWKQVEEAGDDNLKLENWDRDLEWVMMDEDFDDRTRRVFDDVVVVYTPHWWGRYYGGGYAGAPSAGGTGGTPGGAPDRLPTLPGSRFANEVTEGATGFAGSILGDVGSFTGGVTSVTNPVPVSTSSGRWSGGGGGGGCACACACAGCACACAGGGR